MQSRGYETTAITANEIIKKKNKSWKAGEKRESAKEQLRISIQIQSRQTANYSSC